MSLNAGSLDKAGSGGGSGGTTTTLRARPEFRIFTTQLFTAQITTTRQAIPFVTPTHSPESSRPFNQGPITFSGSNTLILPAGKRYLLEMDLTYENISGQVAIRTRTQGQTAWKSIEGWESSDPRYFSSDLNNARRVYTVLDLIGSTTPEEVQIVIFTFSGTDNDDYDPLHLLITEYS